MVTQGVEDPAPACLASSSPPSADSPVSNPMVKPIVRDTLMSAWSASRNALTALKACMALSSGTANSDVGSFIHAAPQFGQSSGRLAHRMRGKLTAVRHALQRKKTARISSRSMFISSGPFRTAPAILASASGDEGCADAASGSVGSGLVVLGHILFRRLNKRTFEPVMLSQSCFLRSPVSQWAIGDPGTTISPSRNSQSEKKLKLFRHPFYMPLPQDVRTDAKSALPTLSGRLQCISFLCLNPGTFHRWKRFHLAIFARFFPHP